MRLINCALLISLLAISCTPVAQDGDLSLGPIDELATWSIDGAMGSRTATTGVAMLKLEDGCLYLVLEDGHNILPIWPEPTSWDAASGSVQFVGPQGEQLELQIGDRILLGGSPPNGSVPFSSPPNPACEADDAFIVSSVSLVNE